ncbi:hypothetical protein TrRE_jg7735, partial [Triparma retinervis]
MDNIEDNIEDNIDMDNIDMDNIDMDNIDMDNMEDKSPHHTITITPSSTPTNPLSSCTVSGPLFPVYLLSMLDCIGSRWLLILSTSPSPPSPAGLHSVISRLDWSPYTSPTSPT